MHAIFILLTSALILAPNDRLALADRLFNKSEYALAADEYAALENEKSIPADALLYRRAECARALGQDASARTCYEKLVAAHPTSAFADTARLRLALTASGDARVRELKLLDSDRVKPDLRAEALFHLGEATDDADAYARCAKVDPKGHFRPHAILRRGAILAKSARDEDRRQAVSLFLEIAFGQNPELSESALYLASATSFSDRKYSEAGSLARRYLKVYASGKHATACTEMAAWCDYLGGRFSDAIVCCGAGKTDGTAYVKAAATQATGDAEQARRLFGEYLAAYPQGRYRKDAELALARLDYAAAEKSGDGTKTVESARRGLLISDSAADRLRLAWAYEKNNRSDEALREYKTIAERYPGSREAASALFQKAMIDLRAERWSAADLALQEALVHTNRLDAQHIGEARYWRGIAMCRLGHAFEGAQVLKQAVETGISLDQSREARLMIADIDYNAGRTNEAVRSYVQLVREGATERMSAAKTLAVGRLMPPAERKTCAQTLTKSSAAEWRQAGYALLADAEEALGNAAAQTAALEKCAAEKCETEALGQIAVKLGERRMANGDFVGAEAILKKAVTLQAKNDDARARAYLALARNARAKGDPKAACGYATVVVTLFEGSPHVRAATQLLQETEAK